MKCPIDQTTLQITNRNNIEIDYCPECRGVWLDRGELDKIIERSEQPANQSPVQSKQNNYQGDSYYHGKHKRKKESFIGDLFDF